VNVAVTKCRLQRQIDTALEQIVKFQTTMSGELVQNVCKLCKERATRIEDLRVKIESVTISIKEEEAKNASIRLRLEQATGFLQEVTV
jgi:hypothetical protein